MSLWVPGPSLGPAGASGPAVCMSAWDGPRLVVETFFRGDLGAVVFPEEPLPSPGAARSLLKDAQGPSVPDPLSHPLAPAARISREVRFEGTPGEEVAATRRASCTVRAVLPGIPATQDAVPGA